MRSLLPTVAAEAAKWDAFYRMALGVIMSTASKLTQSDCLLALHENWQYSMGQSRDAPLRHQAWLNLFSTRKSPHGFSSALASRMEGLWA